MQFTADEYCRAGQERILLAQKIYQEGSSYALAMYCGGLAVELILRAFRWQIDNSFDGRHDLHELFRASRILGVDEDSMRRRNKSDDEIRASARELHAALNQVLVLWHNNLRFASEARLKAYLKQMDRLGGIKGDPLKKNAKDLVEAAHLIVNRGVVLWTSNKK